MPRIRPFSLDILDPSITDLSFLHVPRLEDDDVSMIAAFLMTTPAVTSLSFYPTNELGSRVTIIIDALMSNANITALNLNNCGLGVPELNHIGRYLKSPAGLHLLKLDVGGNLFRPDPRRRQRYISDPTWGLYQIPSHSLQPLPTARRELKKELKARRLQIKSHPQFDFFSGISMNSSLTDLSIASIRIDEGFPLDRLLDTIRSNMNLVSLNLCETGFYEERYGFLFQAIDCSNIRTLDLSRMHYGTCADLQTIALWLRSSAKITTLILNPARWDEAGEALWSNQSL